LLEEGEEQNTLFALKELAEIASEIPEAIQQCGATIHDFEKLLQAIKTLSSPTAFVYHVEKDIKINGVQIF